MISRDGDTVYYPVGVTGLDYCVLKFTAATFSLAFDVAPYIDYKSGRILNEYEEVLAYKRLKISQEVQEKIIETIL